MKIEVGKYYRTRDGRKVGPIGYNSYITNYGRFFSGETVWDEFGRLYQATKETDHDLIAEWTEDETGTLAELDVKPWDVVEYICVGPKQFYTVAGDYTVQSHQTGNVICYKDAWHNNENFRIISRASDTPKTWGEMTDAEKGELLLAEYEGGNFTLQYRRDEGETWGTKHISEGFCDDLVYRIKPEPVRETVVMEGACFSDVWRMSQTGFIGEHTHRITFTTIDGEPDLSSIKMEEV